MHHVRTADIIIIECCNAAAAEQNMNLYMYIFANLSEMFVDQSLVDLCGSNIQHNDSKVNTDKYRFWFYVCER